MESFFSQDVYLFYPEFCFENRSIFNFCLSLIAELYGLDAEKQK